MTGEHSGGVIWICGLSGVGKTTLATELARLMREVHGSVAAVDGDDFRKNFMPEAGYERSDRLVVARSISKLAWSTARQGSLCVVATISMFTEIHDNNRACEQTYQLPLLVSLLSAPKTLRLARRPSLMHDNVNRVGTHIKAELPGTPDHTFVNDGHLESLRGEALILRQRWLARQQLFERHA